MTAQWSPFKRALVPLRRIGSLTAARSKSLAINALTSRTAPTVMEPSYRSGLALAAIRTSNGGTPYVLFRATHYCFPLIFVFQGDNRLAWTNHGKCTDLTDGSLSDGNRVRHSIPAHYTRNLLCSFRYKSGLVRIKIPIRFGMPVTWQTTFRPIRKVSNPDIMHVDRARTRAPFAKRRGSSELS